MSGLEQVTLGLPEGVGRGRLVVEAGLAHDPVDREPVRPDDRRGGRPGRGGALAPHQALGGEDRVHPALDTGVAH